MSLDKNKLCYQLKVATRVKESSDSITLALDIPDEHRQKFRYKAGQFVTFFLDINGQELHRSYSLCTSPDYDKTFAVTVKLVPGGKGSTYLTERVNVGDILWTTPPAGRFTLPEKLPDKLVFYAGGSGITPVFSLIKTALNTTSAQCVLFYQNRNEESVIFREALAALEKDSNGRLSVTHVLSNPSAAWPGLKGRADHNLIREFLIRHQIGIRSLHFLCGPDGFMKTVETTLKSMSVDQAKIIQESFAISVSAEATAAESSLSGDSQSESPDGNAAKGLPNLDDMVKIGDLSAAAAPAEIEVCLEGETKVIPYKGNASILETLLEAGLNPPYSCMDGACMACMAKIEKGLVYQKDPGILSDDNIDSGECLTCQARPAAKLVRVNYNVF